MSKTDVQKIYIDEDPNATLTHETCPECAKQGKTFNLRYMHINYEEAVYKCSSPDCMFPYRNFKFKNFVEKTVYRYNVASSEDDTDNEDVDNWLDSLSFSPAKTQKAQNETYSSSEQAFSHAMDQLQDELNEILSSHCKEIEKSASDISPSPSPPPLLPEKTEKTPQKKPQSDKPRKLSKCYDFIRQKSGGTLDVPKVKDTPEHNLTQSTSFKVPHQPVKEAINSLKMNLQSPKKHRSGRSSKRHSKTPVAPQSSPKKPKKGSETDRSQALSFLNHVEMFNKCQKEPENIPMDTQTTDIPFRIDILPLYSEPQISSFNNSLGLKIKVEENKFSYY
ncbi:uncharacterized protein LOC134832262 [Culicoides brevitarsis]|uniref:uncharacterized protein LOC134832262 n=1 Tax=Culicoides brevitarsis TaxID=469753 RepID=UPI00307C1B43